MDSEATQFSSVNIDRAIELFCFIRETSKDNTPINADQLFALDGSFTSTLLAGCRDDPPHVISTLQAFKSLSSTLHAVSDMLDSAITELSRELTPNIHKAGMASLPDEILAGIFECAFDLAERHRDIFTRSIVRVCRRYRRIALKSPRLWTFIKFKAGLDVDTELYLTLSRNKALSVEIDCDEFKSAEELREIMRSVEPAADRLEELTIRATEEKSHSLHFFAHLREDYNEVDFRTLNVLHLEYWEPDWSIQDELPDEEEIVEEEEEEEFVKIFFRNWKMPALQVLDLSNQIPSDTFIRASNLTHLHLTLGSDERGSNGSHWSTRLILAGLRCFENSETLEELSVKLLNAEFSKSYEEPVYLASVRKLSYNVEGSWPENFAPLARKLEFPKLEHLNIRIDMIIENFEDWLAPFCHKSRYGGDRLTHITLDIEVNERDCKGVSKFLQYYRNVRYLQLMGDCVLPDTSLGENLERLRIENSRRIDRDFLDNVRRTNDRIGRHSKPISNVELVNCPFIDDKAFQDNLPVGSELVWRSGSGDKVINGRAKREPCFLDEIMKEFILTLQSEQEP